MRYKFNNIKMYFLNLSKTLVDKTGEYSKIVKLSLDIKKNETDIEKRQTEIGRYIIEKIKGGEINLDLKDQTINKYAEQIKKYEKSIEEKRIEIERLKKADASGDEVIEEKGEDKDI